ncbi:MAG TPA: hypothetical protein VFR32_01555 [Gaiellaceae bacterium]|nr:hypothetical protein [Gaiellaceae bacterium]
MGTLQLVAGLGALAAAAVLIAAALRLPTATDAVLAAYLVFAALAVAIPLALSPPEVLTATWLLAAAVCALVASGSVWWLRGRPALPFQDVVRTAREALGDPAVLLLTCAVGLALAYAAALAVGTVANNHDSLWYHLARPAFWKQEHGVGYVVGANDARLDVFPPGAELVSSWAMVLEGSERFASLFQLLALLATVLAVFGIARRLGLTPRQAAFGAVILASLPVVALQASTPLNDLVVCSYVVAAVYFVLSRARHGFVLAALALALAVATKGTALLAVPLVGVAAAVMRPPREWPRMAALGAGALLVGAFWYVVNLAQTGDLLPSFVEHDEPQEKSGSVAHALGQVTRMVVDAFDPAGAIGSDRYLYAVAAGALVLFAAVLGLRGRSWRAALALGGAAALTLVPLAMPSVYDGLLRAHQRLWVALDEPAVAFLAFSRDPAEPSPFFSWYGPLGLLVLVAATPVLIHAIRRGRLPRATIAFLVAPAWFLVLVVLVIDYNVGHGRYLMPAVALSAATWGVIVDVRPLAWFAAVAGTVTLALSFVHYVEKPAGVTLLGGESRPSVWGAARATILVADHVAGPFAAVDELAKPGDVVALRLRQDDVSYPYFGAELDRTVVFAGTGEPAEADWLVVAPGLAAPACEEAWTEEPSRDPGWRLYKRSGTCPSTVA